MEYEILRQTGGKLIIFLYFYGFVHLEFFLQGEKFASGETIHDSPLNQPVLCQKSDGCSSKPPYSPGMIPSDYFQLLPVRFREIVSFCNTFV